MNVPEELSLWTYETVLLIVRSAEYEPARFEYKEVLHPTGPEGRDALRKSIARTTCSMANSGGGFVLFGIKDRQCPVAQPEDRIVGVPLDGDLRKEFGEKVARSIQPELRFETVPRAIPLPGDDQRGVFVVHIPLSPLRPHMVRPEGIFYRRGDGGAANVMDWFEVRELMLHSEERLRKLRLLRLELAQYGWFTRQLRGMGMKDVAKATVRFDTNAFKILLADVCGLLPVDNDLVGDLLEVASFASLINQALDQYAYRGRTPPKGRVDFGSSESPFSFTAVAIMDNLHQLWILCDSCERHLAELFGPMTGVPYFATPED